MNMNKFEYKLLILSNIAFYLSMSHTCCIPREHICESLWKLSLELRR